MRTYGSCHGPARTAAPIAQRTARLGASSEDEVRALVGDVDPAELIARGVRVETGRVTREVLHVVRGAEGFFAASTPSQRETLRVLAWSAAQGDRDWRRLVAQRSLGRGARTASATHDTAMRAQARAHRDQLADVLGAVHAGDDVTRRRITAATQPTASGEVDTGPGQALHTLVSIGRASLTHAAPQRRRGGAHDVAAVGPPVPSMFESVPIPCRCDRAVIGAREQKLKNDRAVIEL